MENTSKKNDLVSVIIPVYNREKLVGKTIISVFSQTNTNYEVILIDDGSTDGTLQVLESFKREYPDKIVVICQKQQGQVVARNNGIKKAKGEYIAFLDSDDLWMPRKLEKQLPLFKGKVGLVYCAIDLIDLLGNTIKSVLCEEEMRGDIYEHLLVKNRMTGGTVIISREAIQKIGLFDTNLKAAENWDLWIRVSKEFQVDYVNEPLLKYLKHEGNMSASSELMFDAHEALLNKHFIEKSVKTQYKASFDQAYAHYFFMRGVNYFNKGDYSASRRNLKHSIQLYSGDTAHEIRIRIFRSYLGRRINQLLSLTKKVWNE